MNDQNRSDAINTIASAFGMPAAAFKETESSSSIQAAAIAFGAFGKQMRETAAKISKAFDSIAAVWLPYMAEMTALKKVVREREQIMYALGYLDQFGRTDANAPQWVRDVHDHNVRTFGSGNGEEIR